MAEDREALAALIAAEEERRALRKLVEQEEARRNSQKRTNNIVPHGTTTSAPSNNVLRGTNENVPRGTDDEVAKAIAIEDARRAGTPLPEDEEENVGFFSNLVKGGKHGKEDVVRQATILKQLMEGEVPEPIPVTPSEELGLSRKSIGQFIGRMGTSGAPTLGAGLIGGAAGAAAGSAVPVVGNVVGALGGAATASTPVAAAQAYADAYNEARLSGQDHEKALDYAGKVAKVAGGVNAISTMLGGVGVKDAFLKHAIKQIPIQTAAANVENVTRNIVAKVEEVDPERALLAGAKEATFGPGALHVASAAGTKAVSGAKNVIKGGKAENVPHGTSNESIASKTKIEPQFESVESNVPRGTTVEQPVTNVPHGTQETVPHGTTEKPRLRFDPETQKWVASKKATNEKTSVVPIEETNLSRKKGITEEQKIAADVDLDQVHKNIFGDKPIEKPPSFLGNIIDKSKNAYKAWFSQQNLFDAHAPIKAMEAKSGVKTPGEGTAYRGARFARNVSGTLKAAFDYGRPYWDNAMQVMRVNTNAPGFTTIIKSVAKTPKMLKDFQTYAYARRVKANNLIELGQEQNMKHHEVDAAIKMGDDNPQFKQAFAEIQEYNKAILDVMEETGLINKDKRLEWEQEDYVPFYRDLGEELGLKLTAGGNKLAGQKAKIKPLKGEKKMWQVLDEQGKEINRFPSEKEAQEFAQQHDLKAAEENVGHKTTDVIENLYKNISSFLPAAMRNAAAVETLHKAMDLGAAQKVTGKEAVNALGNKRPDVVTVMEDGKPVNYKVTDPDMYKAVTESYNRTGERNLPTKILQGMKSVYSAAIVTNPQVAIGIAAKDIIQSGLVGKYSMGNIKGILVDLPKEIIKSYGHEFGIKTDQRLVDISAMGAESRYSNISPEMRQRQMQRYMDKHNGKMLTWVNKDSLRAVVDKIITPLENANRLRKFEAARKAGKDIATAGYEALDYMDYGKKGSGGLAQFLIDFVPFAGSHLSSSHTLGTELAHNKGLNKTTAKLLTLSAFSGLNASFNLDDSNDPDPSNGYMAQPDYVRDNNWLIDTYKFSNGKERFENGDIRWIVIPKPWEAGQLGGSVIENLMAYQKGEEDGMDILNYMRKQFMDYLTINPAGMPIIKTPFEQYANKQFFLNMPIVPRQTEELAPFLQYGPKTSETAKKIGAAINFSPARIEHAAKGILGSYADYIFMAGDILNKDKSQGEKPESDKVSDKYIFNKFVKGTVLERTSYENEMYELYRATKEAAKTLKQLDKIAGSPSGTEEDDKKADKYAEKNEDLIANAGYADSMRKMTKEFNDEIALIRKDKELSGREKKAAIDEVIKEKNQALYDLHQEIKAEKRANKKGK